MKATEFDDELFHLINAVVRSGEAIETLSIKRPNWINRIERNGIWVETEKSRREGGGPQLVPAWMVVAAWEFLRKNHIMSQNELLNGLNVKRSAFVCALLALFPDVVVRGARPTVLEFVEN